MKEPFDYHSGRISVQKPETRDIVILREQNMRLQARVRALEEFERQVQQSFFWRCTKSLDRWAERLFPARSHKRKAYNWLILLVRSITLSHNDRNRLRVSPWRVLLSCLWQREFTHVSTDRVPRYNDPEMGYEQWLERQNTLLTRSFAHMKTTPGLVRVIRVASDAEVDGDPSEINGSKTTRQTFAGGDDITADGLNRVVSSLSEEWLIFLENFDYLHPHTPDVIEQVLSEQPDTELIYWDHDSADRNKRQKAFFKPAWSPSLLLSQNYIGNAFAMSGRLFEYIGGFNRLSLYDLLLRATFQNSQIVHIPRLLLSIDTRLPRRLKLNDQESLSSALVQRGRKEIIESSSNHVAIIRRQLEQEPLVSIIIPTRDRASVLEQCLKSLTKITDYPNYEIIIADNNSRESETAALFRRWEGQIRIFSSPGPFNFSAINNRAAGAAEGELLLFLNNDVEIIEPQWLNAMVEQAIEPDVGAIGAKLLYPDGTIQHAGIVVGLSGLADNALRGAPGTGTAYHNLENSLRECSALTAACLLIRRKVFEEMNGFNENFKVCFGDVDLGLRLLVAGYRNLYVPSARLMHHECLSRPRTSPAADILEAFRTWAGFIYHGDPFYNPNLDLFEASFVRSQKVPRIV